MTGCCAQVRATFGLKPDIQLADVMQRGEDAESSARAVGQSLAGEAGEPTTPEWQREQRLDDSSYVGAVVRERMPFDNGSGVRVMSELPPKTSWLSAHGNS